MPRHSTAHPATPAVLELLDQAMAYGRNGGAADSPMANGKTYAEAFIDALTEMGVTLTVDEPDLDPDVAAALADSDRAVELAAQNAAGA